MDQFIDTTCIHLETTRLYLRSWNINDLDDFYAYAKVEGVGPMCGWLPHQSKKETLRVLTHFINGKKEFALVDKQTQHVIGSLGLNTTERWMSLLDQFDKPLQEYLKTHYGRELGFVLSKDYWGQGLMKEALDAVFAYCFNEGNFDYFFVSHFIDNYQSQRVIEKCGFQYLLQAPFETNLDQTKQAKIYILTKEEYLKFNKVKRT